MNRKQMIVAWILCIWVALITVFVGAPLTHSRFFEQEMIKAWVVYCLPALILGFLLIYTLRNSEKVFIPSISITETEPKKGNLQNKPKYKILNRYYLFILLMILKAILMGVGADNNLVFAVTDLALAVILIYIIIRFLGSLPSQYARWRGKQGA